MLDSIYIGMTGLLGYSKDLSVIGNNVANVNTPGFKSSQLIFSDLFYRSQFGDGNGARQPARTRLRRSGTAGTRLLFAQGELRQSGNALDVAHRRQRLLRAAPRRPHVLHAARASSRSTTTAFSSPRRARRASPALSGGGLSDINITGQRTNAGKATAKASFTGVLNSGTAASAPVDVDNIVVYDSAGVAHTLTLQAHEQRDRHAGQLAGRGARRRRQGAGAAARSASTPTARRPPASTASSSRWRRRASRPTEIELELRRSGLDRRRALDRRRSTATCSSTSQDGFAVGSLTTGHLRRPGLPVAQLFERPDAQGRSARARVVHSLQGLQPLEGNLFEPRDDQAARARQSPARACSASSAPGRVELSNVELSQEFGDLIISQRGYQASSQVISTANEMVQQLFDIKARR